jgi:hypothetical protein
MQLASCVRASAALRKASVVPRRKASGGAGKCAEFVLSGTPVPERVRPFGKSFQRSD